MSGRTLVAGAGKTTCGKCSRPVQMVRVAGDLVAVDPEVMAFVPAGKAGEVIASNSTMTGRRVHAELCTSYQLEVEREQRRRELADYNRRNGVGPRKTRSL
jgi:hypothetical protein